VSVHPVCEACGEREATYHEVVKVNGVVHERHLCEVCAAARGLIQPPAGVTDAQAVLEQLAEASKGGPPGQPSSGASRGEGRSRPGGCPGCGLTFAEFKRSGLLGCAECYSTFERQLTPLLERAHEGGTRHVGKTPRRALRMSEARGRGIADVLGDARERAERVRDLRRQLDAAVQGEQFELAARLRDEIRRGLRGGERIEDDPAAECAEGRDDDG